MNVCDVIPYLNISTETAFPSSCFQAEWNKGTVYAREKVEVHLQVPQISTDFLILWIKWHALNVHTCICIFEYIYTSHSKIGTIQIESKAFTFLTSTF